MALIKYHASVLCACLEESGYRASGLSLPTDLEKQLQEGGFRLLVLDLNTMAADNYSRCSKIRLAFQCHPGNAHYYERQKRVP